MAGAIVWPMVASSSSDHHWPHNGGAALQDHHHPHDVMATEKRPDSCRLTARCTPTFRAAFLRLCRQRGLDQAVLIRLLIRDELERRGFPMPDQD